MRGESSLIATLLMRLHFSLCRFRYMSLVPALGLHLWGIFRDTLHVVYAKMAIDLVPNTRILGTVAHNRLLLQVGD